MVWVIGSRLLHLRFDGRIEIFFGGRHIAVIFSHKPASTVHNADLLKLLFFCHLMDLCKCLQGRKRSNEPEGSFFIAPRPSTGCHCAHLPIVISEQLPFMLMKPSESSQY